MEKCRYSTLSPAVNNKLLAWLSGKKPNSIFLLDSKLCGRVGRQHVPKGELGQPDFFADLPCTFFGGSLENVSEFPESLVLDWKSRVPQSKTHIGLGLALNVQGLTRLIIAIGLVVMAPVAIDLESVLYRALARFWPGESRLWPPFLKVYVLFLWLNYKSYPKNEEGGLNLQEMG